MRIAAYDHKMDAVTIFDVRHAPDVLHGQVLPVRFWRGTKLSMTALSTELPPVDAVSVVETLWFRFIRIAVVDDRHHELEWWTIAADDEATSSLLRAIYLDEFWVRPGRAPEKLLKHDRQSLQMEIVAQLGRAVAW